MKKLLIKTRTIRRQFQAHLVRVKNSIEYFVLQDIELNYNYEDDYTPCTDRSEC